VERAVRGLDHLQQRHHVPAFIVGVVKKFGDDRGPTLSALLAYYGFLSLFPLMLVLTTVLGFIGNDRISTSIIGTTLKEFPVFGDQIGSNAAHPLTGNTVGLVVGLLGLLYGSLGVAQAAQHAMAQIWNVPGVVRPGFVPRVGRSLLFFATLAIGLSITAAVSGLATVGGHGFQVALLLLLAAVVLNVGVYVAAFRVLTPAEIRTSCLMPGAIVGGIGYSILLTTATGLLQHQLRHAQALYGQFAFVLGLIGWLYFVAQLSLYAAEINVVRSRRLWPRSIVQPPLTDADRRVLHDIARQEERRPEQRVGVGFEPDALEQVTVDAARRPVRR
jgi:YihY family inner membrane protein